MCCTGGQQTREQAYADRTAAGTHPKQLSDFRMGSATGEEVTKEDLKGVFTILMFGDGITNHALQGLHKLQEIILSQGGRPHFVLLLRTYKLGKEKEKPTPRGVYNRPWIQAINAVKEQS